VKQDLATIAPVFDLEGWSQSVRYHLSLLDISGRKAARQAGVSVATFSRACSGAVNPDLETYLLVNRWVSATKAMAEARKAYLSENVTTPSTTGDGE
jgi:predicted transcriptional regulator